MIANLLIGSFLVELVNDQAECVGKIELCRLMNSFSSYEIFLWPLSSICKQKKVNIISNENISKRNYI